MKFLFWFMIFIFTSTVAHAGFWKETWDEIASPVTTDAKYYLLGGALLTGTLAYDGVEDALIENFEEGTRKDKPLGKTSRFGDLAGKLVPNAIYVIATYSLYQLYDDPVDRKHAMLMIKATLYGTLTTTILKYTVREPRPGATPGRDSFPSGHTTSAFAFASVVASEHAWYWGVAAYSLATFVGYSRINDSAHHLHDVVAGATIGISYGLGLHYLYKDENSEIAKFSVAPYGDGLIVGYQTTF